MRTSWLGWFERSDHGNSGAGRGRAAGSEELHEAGGRHRLGAGWARLIDLQRAARAGVRIDDLAFELEYGARRRLYQGRLGLLVVSGARKAQDQGGRD